MILILIGVIGNQFIFVIIGILIIVVGMIAGGLSNDSQQHGGIILPITKHHYSSGLFTVKLHSTGNKKINAIKVMRELFPSLSLKEAKETVDSAPAILVNNVSQESALHIKERLESEGAVVITVQTPVSVEPVSISTVTTPTHPTPSIPMPSSPAYHPLHKSSPNSFDLILQSASDEKSKTQIRQTLKRVLNMDLLDAYNAVENLPHELKINISKHEAEELKKQLETTGAVIVIRQSADE